LGGLPLSPSDQLYFRIRVPYGRFLQHETFPGASQSVYQAIVQTRLGILFAN